MRKNPRWLILLLFTLLLAACSGLPAAAPAPAEEAALPTTTPEPVTDTPVPTETPLPPPTVTPFPSVTPEGGVAEETGEAAEEASEGSDPADAAEEPAAPVHGIPADVPLGQRLYLADFTTGSWPTLEEDNVLIDLLFGGYLFEVSAGGDAWMNAGIEMADYYTQVEVDVQRCPQDAKYGMRFRMVDSLNYYVFVIWCNDTFSIGSELGGDGKHGTILSRTELPASLSGKTESKRTIGILAQGSDFTVYLDGTPAHSFSDSAHLSGDLAIWTHAADSVLRVVYDNLEVYELK